MAQTVNSWVIPIAGFQFRCSESWDAGGCSFKAESDWIERGLELQLFTNLQSSGDRARKKHKDPAYQKPISCSNRIEWRIQTGYRATWILGVRRSHPLQWSTIEDRIEIGGEQFLWLIKALLRSQQSGYFLEGVCILCNTELHYADYTALWAAFLLRAVANWWQCPDWDITVPI
jgi:hypothetical protein